MGFIITSALIFVLIYIIYAVSPNLESIKKKRKYKAALLGKYSSFSRTQLKSLYRDLLELDTFHRRGQAASEKAKEVRGDKQIDLLITALVPDTKRKEFEAKYHISVSLEYIKYDIDYVKSRM